MIPLFRFGLIANGSARDGEGYRTRAPSCTGDAMKFFDGFLVICAFALSTIMTATLFATFAAWGYAALGPYERDLIAAALGAPPSAAASAITASASAAQPGEQPIVVEFEPVTVVGHFRPVREPLAQSPTPVAN